VHLPAKILQDWAGSVVAMSITLAVVSSSSGPSGLVLLCFTGMQGQVKFAGFHLAGLAGIFLALCEVAAYI